MQSIAEVPIIRKGVVQKHREILIYSVKFFIVSVQKWNLNELQGKLFPLQSGTSLLKYFAVQNFPNVNHWRVWEVKSIGPLHCPLLERLPLRNHFFNNWQLSATSLPL